MGVSMAGVLYQPAFAAITGWFSSRTLGALTTITLVAGLASTVFAPLAALVSTHQGWRATYLWAALVLAVVTVPLHAFLLRLPWPPKTRTIARGVAIPSEKAYSSAIIRSPRFWLLAAGFTITTLAVSTALLALVPFMLERGMSMQEAAWMLGLGGVGQVAGRLVYTPLAQRVSLLVRTTLVFGSVAVTTLALAVAPGPLWLLFAISLLAGFARGIVTLLKATAVTDRWGTQSYGRLSAVLSLPVLFAAALAPWVGTLLAEMVGDYARAYGVLAVLAVGGAILAGISARR
jgi:MFS family permease